MQYDVFFRHITEDAAPLCGVCQILPKKNHQNGVTKRILCDIIRMYTFKERTCHYRKEESYDIL